MMPMISGFNYFDKGIDYFRKPSAEQKKEILPVQTPLPNIVQGADQKEPASTKQTWKELMDPSNDEFFKEGDYTPPEAFMKIARDPSDSNLQNWFKYIALKNTLSDRLEKRMTEYIQKNPGLSPESKTAMAETVERLPDPPVPDHNRYRFRLYVDSNCPHCKRMLGTMETLQHQGFMVELKQVDNGNLQSLAPTFPITKASPNELSAKDINAVPVLFVADLKNKVVFRIGGYQTVETIFNAIHSQKSYR